MLISWDRPTPASSPIARDRMPIAMLSMLRIAAMEVFFIPRII